MHKFRRARKANLCKHLPKRERPEIDPLIPRVSSQWAEKIVLPRYTHKYIKPRWMSDLDTVAHNFPLPTTACRVVMNIFCRESRVEDEVAEELWASSRATAADCLETNYRDGAAVVHSRGNVGLAAACSNQAERLLPPWRRLRNRPNLFIRISFFADRCNGPTHIRSLDKLSTFKRQLKSHLFQSAFAA